MTSLCRNCNFVLIGSKLKSEDVTGRNISKFLLSVLRGIRLQVGLNPICEILWCYVRRRYNNFKQRMLQCMAEVGGEWIWLVYCCSHFFSGGVWRGGEVAHLTQNNVALQKVFLFYSRNRFELSFYFKILSCPIEVN